MLCIGASEESGGSDLQVVETEIRARNGGFDVRGVKKFVSLSTVAGHIMVVARSADHSPGSRHGNVVVIAVPWARPTCKRPTSKSPPGRWTPPRYISTPGFPWTHWSRGREQD
jgi:acyl-ACP dehydrogenase